MQQENFNNERAYTLSLGFFPGIGKKTQRQLLLAFPQFHDLYHASIEHLQQVCKGQSLVANELYKQVHDQSAWEALWKRALHIIEQHKQANISIVSLTSLEYPALLKQIQDPPVVLYAKGDLSLLQESAMIAIVGTRNPTADGERITFHLAKYFATRNYCIVSGLAKGIDTIAHKGALHVQGKTIAVLATPLDHIYPAENKDLAQQIVEQDGLLISELALGEKSFRSAFVQRDRLQSGLSLGIIPIQTALDGGTMHTIRFAQQQGRLVACPYPSKADKNTRQYEGINAVMNSQSPHVYAFQASQVEQSDISARLQKVREKLTPNNLASHEQTYSMVSNQQENIGENTSLIPRRQEEDHVVIKQPTFSTPEETLSQSEVAPDERVSAETQPEQQPSNEMPLQQEQETPENVVQASQQEILLAKEAGKETKKTTTRSKGKKSSSTPKKTKQTKTKQASSTILSPATNEPESQPIDNTIHQIEEQASSIETGPTQKLLWQI